MFLSPRIYQFCRITKKSLTSILERNPITRPNTTNIYSITSTNLSKYTKRRENTKMVKRKYSTMKLYMTEQSPPARAAMMIVDLLGLEVTLEELNPVARDQDEPEYVKINPMRTVPILDEGDFGLGDSHAIMIYLVEKYGKTEHLHLYPKDTKKRAIIHHVLFFECGILFPRLRAIMAPTYMGRLTELSKFMKKNIEDAYVMLEEFLSQRKFVAGEVLTIADFSAYTTTQSLNTLHHVDEKRFPKLKQWLQTMSELDVVKRVNEPGGSMHGATLLRLMEMNKENQQAKAKL